MDIAQYIYLANVIRNIDTFIALVSIAMIVWYGCYTLYCFAELNEYHNKNYLIIVPTVLLFLSAFIPSERTMYMMAGAVMGEKVVETKVAKQALEIIELKLDEEINKLKGK